MSAGQEIQLALPDPERNSRAMPRKSCDAHSQRLRPSPAVNETLFTPATGASSASRILSEQSWDEEGTYQSDNQWEDDF
jgi:hypothetical protein